MIILYFFVLSVMRLTKPTLMPFHPIICDIRDVPYTLTQEQTESDIAKPKDQDYFGVSDLLTLPQNFGYKSIFVFI